MRTNNLTYYLKYIVTVTIIVNVIIELRVGQIIHKRALRGCLVEFLDLGTQH